MSTTVRVAAIGDIHLEQNDPYSAFERLAHDRVDLLLLAGDLTNHGLLTEALSVVRAVPKNIPVIAVLGNHDHESDEENLVQDALTQVGVKFPGPRPVVVDVRGVRIGVAGVKGFCGGFGSYRGATFGEPLMKAFMHEAQKQADSLEDQLRLLYSLKTGNPHEDAIAVDTKIALLHYAPTWATCKGEPIEIQAWGGSSKLAYAMRNGFADIAFHGHMHRGTYAGWVAGIPVRNVARDIVAPYALLSYANGHWSDFNPKEKDYEPASTGSRN